MMETAVYHNPVRRGFYPDPSWIRVGEDYYMVNSSFAFFPCVPISHSRDLVHWTTVGYAIMDETACRLADKEGGRGYWAPDISYDGRRFYITVTLRGNDTDEKTHIQAIVSSERPEGPYSDPVWIDVKGIDPALFHDSDGRHYMLLNPGVRLLELNEDLTAPLTEPETIWEGDCRIKTEGPHLIHKDGYYYIFAAEGGTGRGHRISVARSRNIRGPYEKSPYGPAVQQRDPGDLLQCCGHGNPIELPDGRWYLCYLCLRSSCIGEGTIGRESAIDPLEWTQDGWPLVNGDGRPSHENPMPLPAAEGMDPLYAYYPAWRGREWIAPRPLSLAAVKQTPEDTLQLTGNGLDLNEMDCRGILVERQQEFVFEAQVTLRVTELAEGMDLGLTNYYDENSYVKCGIARRQDQIGFLLEEYVGDGIRSSRFIRWTKEQGWTGAAGQITIRMEAEDTGRRFYGRMAGEDPESRPEVLLGELRDVGYLSSGGLQKGKRFTGATVGIYVHGACTGCFTDWQTTWNRTWHLRTANYRNPILFADYSDPDVIRVGDTYYLTASSFNYTPGLPILTSDDLVHWSLVNYALPVIPEGRFAIPRHSEGVWAPSIRYHDGYFYSYYGMPDEGIYVVRTQDPLGAWEPPVCVMPGKGLIDPCPLWDEDGRVYIIHAYAKSRIGFKSILGMFELSPDGRTAISEDQFIYDGNQPVTLSGPATPEEAVQPALTIEGPKVYRRNGYYYIWAPAGGVKPGWQLVLRSRTLTGEWETRIVLHQGSSCINGPHQGGWVETPSGAGFFLHFQDRGLYGRICHLQPVVWGEDDWPRVGTAVLDQAPCGEPVVEWSGEDLFPVKEGKGVPGGEPGQPETGLRASDDFIGGRIGLQWQWMGNRQADFCDRIPGRDGLRLYAVNPSGDVHPTLWRSANVLTQKLICPEFTADLTMDLAGLQTGDRAGVIMTGAQYTALCVERRAEGDVLLLVESTGEDRSKEERIRAERPVSELPGCGTGNRLGMVTFRMDFHSPDCNAPIPALTDALAPNQQFPVLHLSVKCGGTDDGCITAEWIDSGCAFTPSDHTWVGAKLGVFCLRYGISETPAAADASGMQNPPGYADLSTVSVCSYAAECMAQD
ncbi:MAG: family 43 glycosylhydrolase [Butyrivibrio sp.]|nr:family 43 glycosylhydrolase [Butyrivibrio sp.]